MLDYPVPLKNGTVIQLKAVNWPKVFLLPKWTPCKSGETPREKLFELLSAHPVPIGTESKHLNTIAFFDHALKEIASEEKPRKPATKKTR